MDAWNLMPLCRDHHQEQHRVGWFQISIRYPLIFQHLESLGWHFVDSFGVKKLVRKDNHE